MINVSPRTRRRTPIRYTLLKFERPRSVVKGRPLRGETAPSLSTAAFHDGASCPSSHANSEAMSLLAAPNVRLVGAFHEVVPDRVRSPERLQRAISLSKAGRTEGAVPVTRPPSLSTRRFLLNRESRFKYSQRDQLGPLTEKCCRDMVDSRGETWSRIGLSADLSFL